MILLALLLQAVVAWPQDHFECARRLHPREVDAGRTFGDLVAWIEREIIGRHRAPGLVVGVSGTDSILAFLAAAQAFENVGRPERAVALHFGPADGSDWVQREILPWLRHRVPRALVLDDATIDHRRDGLRWGALLDWSVLEDPSTGRMRPPERRYWVVGTRNRSETMLGTFSNLSRAASLQPLSRLWKSEVLQLCRHLGVPRIALEQSCEADCTCGREQFPALHIPEVDAILMERAHELQEGWTERVVGRDLYLRLEHYVDSQIAATGCKGAAQHEPAPAVPRLAASVSDADLLQMQQLMALPNFSGRALAQIVPRIVIEGRANVAAGLVTNASPEPDRWLGEALALLNTPGLRSTQRRRMVERIFGVDHLDLSHALGLARAGARIANYGYSFPRWRFLFKGFDGQPSLAERWRFQPVRRDGGYDLGAGFAIERGPWRAEFRQAYLAVTLRDARAPVSLLIRNNNTVFGRDQIPDAAYVAFGALSDSEMDAINADRLARDRRAIVLSHLLRERPDLAPGDKISRVLRALDVLSDVKAEFDGWLKSPAGSGELVETLRRAIENHPVWVGRTGPEEAPWSPRHVVSVTPELLDRLAAEGVSAVMGASDSERRLTLLSGPRGDFP